MKILYTEASQKQFTDLKIDNNTNLIILKLVSCMLDNVSYLKIKKVPNDVEPKVYHYNNNVALAISNLQMREGAVDDIKWAFLNRDLQKIISVVNSGTSKIFEVKIF